MTQTLDVPSDYYYKYIAHPKQWQKFEQQDTVAPAGETTKGKLKLRSEPQKTLGHASHQELEQFGSDRTSWTQDPHGARRRAGWDSDSVVRLSKTELEKAGGRLLTNKELLRQVDEANVENVAKKQSPENSRVRTARRFYARFSEAQVVGSTPPGVVKPIRWWEGRIPMPRTAPTPKALIGRAAAIMQVTESTPANSGTINPVDPHLLDAPLDEGTWNIRAIWALITGQDEPPDVPRHIRLQREQLSVERQRDELEQQQRELERQQRLQELERFNLGGSEGGPGRSF
jgi:hypothetical protein